MTTDPSDVDITISAAASGPANSGAQGPGSQQAPSQTSPPEHVDEWDRLEQALTDVGNALRHAFDSAADRTLAFLTRHKP